MSSVSFKMFDIFVWDFNLLGIVWVPWVDLGCVLCVLRCFFL